MPYPYPSLDPILLSPESGEGELALLPGYEVLSFVVDGVNYKISWEVLRSLLEQVDAGNRQG